MKKLILLVTNLLLCMFLLALVAQAQDYSASERERKLERIIEQMQEKMDVLEAEVNELKGEENPSELLEGRIESLEKDHEYWFQPNTFRVYWKDRPRFETADKEFQIQSWYRFTSVTSASCIFPGNFALLTKRDIGVFNEF